MLFDAAQILCRGLSNHGVLLFVVTILLYHTEGDGVLVMVSWWCYMLPPLAVLLPLRVRQVIEVQEEGGAGQFATIGRQVQEFLGSAGHRTYVHVPHLLWRVQLQQLLLDLQVLLNISALVFELQDGFGVAVYGGYWGNHTGCEGTPSQTKQGDTQLKKPGTRFKKNCSKSYYYLGDNKS